MTRAQLRCFWKLPLGHRWKHVLEHGDDHLRCAECGKRAKSGSFRPGHPPPSAMGGGGD